MLKQKLEYIEMDSIILSLSQYCPNYCQNIGKTKACQLHKIQKFSFLQKTEWLKKITQNEKLAILLKHEQCFEKNR